MTRQQLCLWEIHLRIPAKGPVFIACKKGGESLTHGVVTMEAPSDALRLIETVLGSFGEGDELFITARTYDSNLSMWRSESKAAGLYWCASALAKLWRSEHDIRVASLADRPAPMHLTHRSS